MRAYAALEVGKCDFIEIDEPVLKDEYGVIVRPTMAATCITDIHIAYEAANGPLDNYILGHESIGVIDQVGSGVQNFKVGDKVIVPALNLYVRPNENPYPVFGHIAEKYYVADADANLVLQPEWISDEAALMVTDMGGTAYSAIEQSNIKFGDSVAVIGIGPVGLTCVAAAREIGAGKIFAVGSRQVCVEVAKEFGADDVINYREVDYAKYILEKTGNRGVDHVVIAGGDSQALTKAMRIARAEGTVTNAAFFGAGEQLPVDAVDWKGGVFGPTVIATHIRAGAEITARIVESLKYANYDITKLITHRFKSMDEVPKSFELIKNSDRSVIKSVITF